MTDWHHFTIDINIGGLRGHKGCSMARADFTRCLLVTVHHLNRILPQSFIYISLGILHHDRLLSITFFYFTPVTPQPFHFTKHLDVRVFCRALWNFISFASIGTRKDIVAECMMSYYITVSPSQKENRKITLSTENRQTSLQPKCCMTDGLHGLVTQYKTQTSIYMSTKTTAVTCFAAVCMQLTVQNQYTCWKINTVDTDWTAAYRYVYI